MDKIQKYPIIGNSTQNSYISITQVIDQNEPILLEMTQICNNQFWPNYIVLQMDIQPKFIYFNHPGVGPNEPNYW